MRQMVFAKVARRADRFAILAGFAALRETSLQLAKA
jgi:hypothetical protein